MKRAAVVYHFFPHYRDGVIKELNKSEAWQFVWIGADIPEFRGIKTSSEWKQGRYIVTPLCMYREVTWQRGLLAESIRGDYDAFIFLANPYFLSTWVAALAARLRGRKVLFWTHGWIGEEMGVKRWVRDIFLGLADSLLLYGERAREIAIARGFPEHRLHVIYNSLDYMRQRKVRDALLSMTVAEARDSLERDFGIASAGALFICTARLIQSCRFDVLIDAVAILQEKWGLRSSIVLVGDGPERTALGDRAREKRVVINFFGACYDESVLGRLIFAADLTVSPGKVGLTAIHSLMFGTPVITHDRPERQFPEVEAIKAGVTGDFFACDDAESLATVLYRWLTGRSGKPQETVQACFGVVDELYNPAMQKRLIEQALEQDTDNG